MTSDPMELDQGARPHGGPPEPTDLRRRAAVPVLVQFVAAALLTFSMGVAIACAVLAFVVLPIATAVGAL